MLKSLISLAPDGLPLKKALDLAEQLGKWAKSLKIHNLLDAYGPIIIRLLTEAGIKSVWVDYKLHDTKDTVAMRVRALVANGAKVITVHASGGVEMMQSAVEAAGDQAEIYAVTVLTSLNDSEIERIYGKDRTREEIVRELALMAKEAGVKTLVCSAQEVGMLKQSPELEGMQCTVPGTRSAGVELGQQKRSGTPTQAVADGADELVAASQVVKAADPVAAFKSMAAEIGMDI